MAKPARGARRIVGIGHATLDFLGQVPKPPDEDTKAELHAASLQGGGPAATAIATAATLGAPCAFVGKVAGDEFGRQILAGLRAHGVDTERCVVDKTRQMSPFAFIQVVEKRGSRTIWYTYGDVEPLDPREIDLRVLDDCGLLLIDGHHAAAQAYAAEKARERGIPVLLDAGGLHEGMGELVPLCDILIASERFASEIAPRGELDDSLCELGRMGPKTVIITLGKGGSVGLEDDRRVEVPAFEEGSVVDTTGAGDVYHGAYAFAVARGDDMVKAMQLASIAAGLSVRALGGRAGIPQLAELEERLERFA